ncbi:MAG: DUF1847 domain-containing protein [Thermacetogeniaceae bacterium]|jgi:uncharacterized metal-binding protein
MYTCGSCTKQSCMTEDLTGAPKNCPCRDKELQAESRAKYEPEEIKKIALQSCKTESEGYCRRTRIEEIMEFAENMGYKKLGVAHCVGFVKEAGLLSKIFKANGFEVDTVCCKCATTSKEIMGMKQWQINPVYEGMCNPIGQAMALEKAGSELAIIVGLCVGHDTLFIKHCNLPVTYLVVKDRVTGHNPVAPLYLSEPGGYYHRRLYPPTRLRGVIGERWTDLLEGIDKEK